MKSNEVYKITNITNGKIYIGITNQGSGARYRHHWYESRIGESSALHRAMAKYGEENFTLEIIDFADTYDELKEKEKFYIKQFDSKNRDKGYNLTDGGDGTFGKMHSEETKEKIRQKAIGRKASEETKQKMSEMRKGRPVSELTKQKTAERNALRAKAVLQFDADMNFIAEHASISDAARATGLNRSTIQKQLHGISKMGKRGSHLIKYIWRYKEVESQTA